jgi:cation transport regulator ChaC
VTLVEAAGAVCDGVAFRVPGAEAGEILARLDHREKNGYERHALGLETTGGIIEALVYVAVPGNFAWLGEAHEDDVAAHIHGAHGPSGANRDYLLELDAALTALGADDDHVRALARRVKNMSP